MTDQPLGSPDPSGEAFALKRDSIVDTVLNLDELLSADVRRAERVARICLRPDLEARLDELEAQLQQLTDDAGRPVDGTDAAVGDTGAAAAREVAEEIQAVQREMAGAFATVRVRQMPDDDWEQFLTRHREALDKGMPYPTEFWDDLIVRSAVKPTISAEQITAMRKALGRPAMDEIASKANQVNTVSGVSVPKSWLSSAVLKPQERAKS